MIFRELKISSLILIFLLAFTTGHSEETLAPDSLPAGESAIDGSVMTVEDAIQRVKEKNLELLVRNEVVQRALSQTFQRRAALLPQFNLTAQQTRMQDGGSSGRTASNAPFNSFSARIGASLTLLDPQQYADFRIAKLGHAIEEFDYEVATQDIMDQVVFVYFTNLRDSVLVDIIGGNLEREEQLLDLAQKQFDAGVAIKLDVTRAEVRVTNAKRELIQARTNAKNSLLQLKELLDIDLDEAILLDRSIVSNVVTPEQLLRFGEGVDLSEKRSEIERQSSLTERSRLARRAVGWQRLPSLGLFADWGYESDEFLDGDEEEAWMVGIRASMPLWEGGRIAAERREADASVRQNEFVFRQIRNAIEREYTFASIEMKSRYDQIEFAWNEVLLGNDEVSQARERYQEGLADNRELIDAQQNLANAERGHIEAVYLYGVSRIAYARSIGSVERVMY